MYGLGFGVGIKAYCPPGTGSRRTSIGETVVIGTVWIGMYWRPDGFRAHDAIRLDCDMPTGSRGTPRWLRQRRRVIVPASLPSPGRINIAVIFAWNAILPAAIESLPPLHRELVGYTLDDVASPEPPISNCDRHRDKRCALEYNIQERSNDKCDSLPFSWRCL